jgi:AcrR family transcriptional regulator
MLRDNRLYDIVDAAGKLFVLKGYNQTQISDIARAAGIATGSIYNLFASKKAIFQFVLACIFDESFINMERTFPIAEMDMRVLEKKIIDRSELSMQEIFPQSSGEDENESSFRDVLSKAFDFISKYGTGLLIFERNTSGWQDLCAVYFQRRKTFIEAFESCVHRCIQKGEIRYLEQPEHHTRLIIETLSWWGMHVKYTYSDIHVEVTDAKKVVMDALTHAYIRQ